MFFFCFHSYPDCAKDPNMVVARHIKDSLAIHSKAQMANAVVILLDQVDKLSEGNSQLSEQSSQLTEQNSQFSAKNSQRCEQLSLVTEQNARLQEENTALVQCVSDLERSVGLNSGNSSKPPSSDGLKKVVCQGEQTHAKPARHFKSQVRRPTRHKGTTLKQVKNPDKITDHFPPRCQACEAAHSPEESIRSAARQVFDLPPPPPLIVTEHRAHTCECHHCGAQTRAAFPEDVTSPAQYGDGITALAAYLQTLHCIPEKRLAQLTLDTYGIKISAATLARLIAKKAKEMNPFAEAMKDQLSGEQTAVKHLDETGLRVAGKTRWVHVLCSIFLSYFRLGASRGDVPEYLLGTAVHDCFSSNWTLEGVEHGVCNSHTLRELMALIVFEKEPWASDMTTILLDALQLTKAARSQGRDAVDPEAIKEIERRYDACCEQAITFHENQTPLTPASKRKKQGRRKRRIGHNLALRFKALKTGVLLFLYDLTVPFTNNEAERDLRMTKVRQKVSGCFRTEEGAENFCILRTVVETARKQGWDIMQTLRNAPDPLILNPEGVNLPWSAPFFNAL